ncbi:hypothetical protein LZ31DRAFT_281429 [Colletotrichum somersetense]|nr:hypothetical protein LZ31DRAFT_281429 [Colletotrichum somersetense]
MASAVPNIIRSLTQEQALKITRRYGPDALLNLLQILNRRRKGKAWKKQEEAFQQMKDALPRLLEDIQAREIGSSRGRSTPPRHSSNTSRQPLSALFF